MDKPLDKNAANDVVSITKSTEDGGKEAKFMRILIDVKKTK
jgi:hypothetical protein